MAIYGMSYFDNLGLVGKIGTPDDPYYVDGPKSDIGRALSGGGDGIAWDFVDENSGIHHVSLNFDQGCHAVADVTGEFVVVLGEKRPHFESPLNAAVFNQNGDLNHVIIPPQRIWHSLVDVSKDFVPDGYASLRKDESDILIGIYFNYDWYQVRSYNIFLRIWGGVRGSGRL